MSKKPFSEIVGEALGQASMAWSESPKGIFETDTCCALHADIMNAHEAELSTLRAELKAERECVDYVGAWAHLETLDGFSLAMNSISIGQFNLLTGRARARIAARKGEA